MVRVCVLQPDPPHDPLTQYLCNDKSARARLAASSRPSAVLPQGRRRPRGPHTPSTVSALLLEIYGHYFTRRGPLFTRRGHYLHDIVVIHTASGTYTATRLYANGQLDQSSFLPQWVQGPGGTRPLIFSSCSCPHLCLVGLLWWAASRGIVALRAGFVREVVSGGFVVAAICCRSFAFCLSVYVCLWLYVGLYVRLSSAGGCSRSLSFSSHSPPSLALFPSLLSLPPLSLSFPPLSLLCARTRGRNYCSYTSFARPFICLHYTQ